MSKESRPDLCAQLTALGHLPTCSRIKPLTVECITHHRLSMPLQQTVEHRGRRWILGTFIAHLEPVHFHHPWPCSDTVVSETSQPFTDIGDM